MPLIKLTKANELGEERGAILVNTDLIATASEGANATELYMDDGNVRWVKETLKQVWDEVYAPVARWDRAPLT
jgi:hypothetical protein